MAGRCSLADTSCVPRMSTGCLWKGCMKPEPIRSRYCLRLVPTDVEYPSLPHCNSTGMSANKESAYGGASTSTGKERKTWDKEEYAKQAREKDAEARERGKERAEALKSGKKVRRREELPKATKLLEAREEPLNLDKNSGRTIIVASGRPGFSCTTCKWTFKDSASYLGHVNGRYHLRKLGQKTKVARSTLEEVQAKITELRERSRKEMDAKKYDFEQRLKEIKDLEQTEKEAKREKKKLEKQALEEEKRKTDQENADPDMMAMMGFSNFD